MKNYSVLLLYPDYIASDFGHETYLAHVEAKDPKEAIKIAQIEVTGVSVEIEDPSDFHPLLVTEGHIEDLRV